MTFGPPASPPKEAAGVATIAGFVAEAAAALATTGIGEPRRLARRLVGETLCLSAAEVFAHPERRVSEAERTMLRAVLRRLAAHEPISRIVGRREFWGRDFILSPDTLDPRPDSETLLEAVLARLPDRDRPYRFLDLGTGTGCLLLALLSEFRHATGIGIDIAHGAAMTARCNAGRLGVRARAGFLVGDWGRAVAGPFDAIVTNPPYIASAALARLPPEVRDHDPPAALDGGADGLECYRAIAADLDRLLPPKGIFVCEIGLGQATPVIAILQSAGLAIERIAPDLGGIARCVVASPPIPR